LCLEKGKDGRRSERRGQCNDKEHGILLLGTRYGGILEDPLEYRRTIGTAILELLASTLPYFNPDPSIFEMAKLHTASDKDVHY